jgi:hypothetical protein
VGGWEAVACGAVLWVWFTFSYSSANLPLYDYALFHYLWCFLPRTVFCSIGLSSTVYLGGGILVFADGFCYVRHLDFGTLNILPTVLTSLHIML